ncbi:permease-like cell division protein FtsX [Amantichitinum ursilacus]|uniref:Cell division protein FtsX n=1 Tax=Amantichitinum ursilacus TaxID=857265 RepID=A0A0N0XK74_9NEIS|nr:permease-like cell division protein FtsX [Amantichitinum ursilacus]KPC52045.1 Cell division protein FtsX [Amantichitinum ursilacus]
MKHWIRLNLIALSRTLGAMARAPLTSLLNLLVIGIAAAFPLGFYLLIASAQSVTAHLPVEPQLSVYLRTSVGTPEVEALKQKLKADPRLLNSRFVSKEEALKQMQAGLGGTDLLAGLTDNPLPDAFVLTARTDVPAEQLEALKSELSTQSAVEQVQLDSAWAHRLQQLIAAGIALLQVVVVLLAVALVLITGNAIRLQIVIRRDEIEVAKLIGATDAFIRRPFVYFAALQGILGGLLACGIVAGARSWLNPSVLALAQSYGQPFSLARPDWLLAAITLAVTTVLCLVGALIAVSRHLRQFR